MDQYEQQISKATVVDAREILGAMAAVVDNQGHVLYNHTSGCQSLDVGAQAADPESTIFLGSAGKFITHVAALQCVDRGLISLDEPVCTYVPELERLEIIQENHGNEAATRPFTMKRPTKKITLRHLLTHTSGVGSLDSPAIRLWKKSNSYETKESDHPIVKMFSLPLLFEPGEGWEYGASIEWTGLLIFRLTGKSLVTYVQENIFDPLGMTSSTYQPGNRPEISARLLQMVERQGTSLVSAEDAVRAPVSSLSDLSKILVDLIAPSPKMIQKACADLLFKPSLDSSSLALVNLRSKTEDYAMPAGIPKDLGNPPVNYTLAGLAVEDSLPLSHMPPGTVTWNGMPNVIWAINRERGLVMVWATQLLPVDDEKAVELAMTFFKNAWDHFGSP